jgi:hypothetical protein
MSVNCMITTPSDLTHFLAVRFRGKPVSIDHKWLSFSNISKKRQPGAKPADYYDFLELKTEIESRGARLFWSTIYGHHAVKYTVKETSLVLRLCHIRCHKVTSRDILGYLEFVERQLSERPGSHIGPYEVYDALNRRFIEIVGSQTRSLKAICDLKAYEAANP